MQTRKDTTVTNYHGTKVPDPYRWLEKTGDFEVDAWIAGQNQQTEEFLTRVNREKIQAELTELWNYPRVSLPRKVSDWYFFQQNDGLQNQPTLYRQKGLLGDREVVLDPNLWSNDGTVALSNYSLDTEGRYLAYTTSAKGSDRQEIRIRDLQEKKNLPEVIRYCKFTNMVWFNQQGFYYSRYPKPGTVDASDESNYNQVYWHELGTDQSSDQLVFACPEFKELSFSPSLTADQRYLMLHVHHGTDARNGFYLQDLGQDQAFRRILEPGKAKFVFLGNEGTDFYFFTDFQAPQGCIIALDLNRPEQENWQIILPEQEQVISQVRYLEKHFLVSVMEKAQAKLYLYSDQGKLLRELKLPGLGSIDGLWSKQNEPEVFISFTSFLYPVVNLHYNLHTGELDFFGKQEFNFDPDAFTTSQVFYPSKDGTKVSLYLVHRRGIQLTGDNPTLLYGYGGFNIPILPSFSASRLWWLKQGGVYAVANLRGGSEYGEKWHQAGMLDQKQNVFDDFMAAAQWLVDNNYTKPSKLAIEGRSNGGLLVAASLVQKPELFGAVICGVPVTDMLRYHKFTVGRYWIPEYGNAEEDPEHFKFLYAYSPLHNVKQRDYPATLVVTADGDDRVVPAHAYKFTASLQAGQKGKAPILLRVDTKSGHGHGKPVQKIIEEHTDVYAFLSKVLGL